MRYPENKLYFPWISRLPWYRRIHTLSPFFRASTTDIAPVSHAVRFECIYAITWPFFTIIAAIQCSLSAITVHENTQSPLMGAVKCPDHLLYPFPILVSTLSYCMAWLSPRQTSFERIALNPIAGVECPLKKCFIFKFIHSTPFQHIVHAWGQ